MPCNIKKILLLCFMLFMITFASNVNAEFDIIFVDVGQGECSIIQCDGESMLIDASTKKKGADVQGALFKLGIEQLDYVVASHPDRDHNSYLDDIIRLYIPHTILLPPIDDNTDNSYYREVIKAAEETGTQKMYPFVGDSFHLGSAIITVYGPHPVLYSEEDNYSLVLMVEFQGIRFLFMGDAESKAEDTMLMFTDEFPLYADVIKVGRHGSDYASSYHFIQAVAPKIAIISCGEDNRYDFPNGDVIMNLLDAGSEDIRVTWKYGDIHLTVIDGELIDVP